jgi:hypothetical protein
VQSAATESAAAAAAAATAGQPTSSTPPPPPPPPGIATTDRDRLREALNSNFTSSSIEGATPVVGGLKKSPAVAAAADKTPLQVSTSTLTPPHDCT